MDALAPEPRRPRPVAGLPALDSRAVAKAWLVELVLGATLDEAAALPTAELAREGPGLAAAVLAALSDDAALMRLAAGGNLAWLPARAAHLAGAAAPAAAVRAAEALRRATQGVILAEARLDPTTSAELADRLAHVCALVAEAAAESRSAGDFDVIASTGVAVDVHGEPDAVTVAEPDVAPVEPPAPLPTGRWRHDTRPAPAPHIPPPRDPVEVLRARDERRAESGSWEAAVERQLERHAHDGNPFALLAVEADGLERLRASQSDGEVDALLESLERTLAGELRPADQLLRPEPGRYWVTAPDTGPTVGRLLAERLAEASSTAAAHRGAPLTVSIGVATCPDDGVDAEALATKADRAMFAARAAGTPVA